MIFAKYFGNKKTPQNRPIPGSGQVVNSAGGYAWELSAWQVLDRFLILGTEGGTYYASEQKLTLDVCENVAKLIDTEGVKVVDRVVEISMAGRAPRNGPAIFALALAASQGNDETRRAALAALPKVCRTGTHLFQFATEVEQMRGWGRGLRAAIGRWYNHASVEDLTYQAIKYRQRSGWTHRDLLRLAHPKPASEAHGALFKWIVDGGETAGNTRLAAFEELRHTTEANAAADLVRRYKLPWEAVPNGLLCQAKVWEALLEDMPLTAMVRSLATMTRVGLLTPGSDASEMVASRLADGERLRFARLHPLSVLVAHATYAAGRGFRGEGQWTPVPRVVDALDSAFYLAFHAVEPAGQRTMVALDVSSSMTGGRVAGSPLRPAEAAAALAMVTLATEPKAWTMAFVDTLRALDLSPKMRLSDAMKHAYGRALGSTDCAAPMLYASKHNLEVDTFVVLTDNETWCGAIHPSQALRAYRDQTGIAAKLVVVAMTSTKFSIADPKDPGMLDVVGFDTATPQAIREFVVA